MKRPLDHPAWTSLTQLAREPQAHLRDLLADPLRQQTMRLTVAGLELDYSRQRVTPAILEQLVALCEQARVAEQAQAMFRGERINTTEDRAVLHVALRGSEVAHPPWGEALSREVAHELSRMLAMAERIRQGELQGFGGHSFTDVVNLGIGGSDLGPRMASQALASSEPSPVRVHFVSNLDPWALQRTLQSLHPAHTLFVVQSKSFTTLETMTLAASARQWLRDQGCPDAQLQQHFVAVTAQPELAREQGFDPAHTLKLWDWVGGRYSVWSSIGLPLAICIGAHAFTDLLAGARAMDEHFLSAPAAHNMPMLLAALGIWNRNFLGASTHHIASYASALRGLPAHLQQLEMESNGKHTHRNGQPVCVDTAPIVWGGLGMEGQHAYFQLVHQGCHLVPFDFIGVRTTTETQAHWVHQHQLVLLNLQAQADAMAWGRSPEQTLQTLKQAGMDAVAAQSQIHHRAYPGNVPSNLIWLHSLTPQAIGALMALYEHKVFCQAAIWDINAFDQWGVELGKSMTQALQAKAD